MIADRLAQRAGPESVNDADRLFAFQQRAIEELVGFFQCFIDVVANEIELGGLRDEG